MCASTCLFIFNSLLIYLSLYIYIYIHRDNQIHRGHVFLDISWNKHIVIKWRKLQPSVKVEQRVAKWFNISMRKSPWFLHFPNPNISFSIDWFLNWWKTTSSKTHALLLVSNSLRRRAVFQDIATVLGR